MKPRVQQHADPWREATLANDVLNTIRDLSKRNIEAFEKENRQLSFSQYLKLVSNDPRTHARTAPQYLSDCFEHFGIEESEHPGGPQNFRIFEHLPEGSSEFPVEGLEQAKTEIFRALRQFSVQGRVDRLILLHGPNGSAKSSLVAAICRGMEVYSRNEKGPLYRYSWVFPREAASRKRVGFGDESARTDDMDSLAHLADDDTAATVAGELNESPLLLLPPDERRTLLHNALVENDISPESFRIGQPLIEGQLCARSQRIFDALLRAYNGDMERVWRHIRVERFFYSRRYRTGMATVEPQMHVDAGIRQLTYDQGLAALPPALRTVTIEEVHGDLVDGNRGIVEYNDFLKRPVEAFKYLLATCEKSTLVVPGQVLWLDTILIGTSNESYLSQFKQIPDFASFKGRIRFIRVPYQRDYLTEAKIYEKQVQDQLMNTPVAPHTLSIAALWGVLTRLRKPDPSNFPKEYETVIGKLDPLGKAELFAMGHVGESFSVDESIKIERIKSELYDESNSDPVYEGVFGASPRDVKTILYSAAENPDFKCLSPLALIHGINEFIKEKSTHSFLQIEAKGEYHNYKKFSLILRKKYRELSLHDARTAAGLIDEGEFGRILQDYLNHASHYTRQQKMRNAATGQMIDPDERLMDEFEQLAGIATEKRKDFRAESVRRVGAFRVDHPDEELKLEKLFANELKHARRTYHKGQDQQLSRTIQMALSSLDGNEQALTNDGVEAVHTFIQRLKDEFGHCDASLREALSECLRSDGTGGSPGTPD